MGGIYYKLGKRIWNWDHLDYRLTLVNRVINPYPANVENMVSF